MDNISENRIKKKKIKFIDNLILISFGFYLVLSPFYLWSSGLPQIGDIFLIFSFIFYMILNNRIISYKTSTKKLMLTGLIFMVWVIISNLRWSLKLQTTDIFLQYTLFYIYNTVIALFTLLLSTKYKDKFLHVIFTSIIISITIQFIIFLIGGRIVGGRVTVSFNNPNQLGYYALIIQSFIIFISNKVKVNNIHVIAGLFFSFILVVASISNSAIISWFVLLVLYIFSKTDNKKIKKTIILSSVLVIISIVYLLNSSTVIQSNSLYKETIQRLRTTEDKIYGSTEGRGYDRITEYPEYWILGAGEGGYFRFNKQIEFHSTLGNIQLSYGIVGLILFMRYLWICSKGDFRNNWYIIFSLLLYGYAHNGIRNTMFWILLSLIHIYAKEKPKITESRAAGVLRKDLLN